MTSTIFAWAVGRREKSEASAPQSGLNFAQTVSLGTASPAYFPAEGTNHSSAQTQGWQQMGGSLVPANVGRRARSSKSA